MILIRKRLGNQSFFYVLTRVFLNNKDYIMPYRLKFSAIYLVTTLILLIFPITLIKIFWYPYPLMQAAGAQKLLTILSLVNIGLAFALAMMIFIESKANFKKDILVSIIIQLLFLIISVYGVCKIRPVWIAYNVDRFELILNNELVNSNVHKVDKRYENPSFLFPQYIGVGFAENDKERTENMFDEALNNISLAQRPERYLPFSQMNGQIKNRAQDLELLKKYNKEDELQFVLNKYPQAGSFVPLQARAVDMTVLLDKNNEKQVIAIVNLRPWK